MLHLTWRMLGVKPRQNSVLDQDTRTVLATLISLAIHGFPWIKEFIFTKGLCRNSGKSKCKTILLVMTKLSSTCQRTTIINVLLRGLLIQLKVNSRVVTTCSQLIMPRGMLLELKHQLVRFWLNYNAVIVDLLLKRFQHYALVPVILFLKVLAT